MDFRNFVKLCPFCSMLVPKVSISGIFGTNFDYGLLSPFCFGIVVVAGVGLILVVSFVRLSSVYTYCVDYVIR